jgi:hypothetical protein
MCAQFYAIRSFEMHVTKHAICLGMHWLRGDLEMLGYAQFEVDWEGRKA